MRLPVAPAALPGSDLTFDRLAVVLDAQGRLRVGGQSLDEDGGDGVVGRAGQVAAVGPRDRSETRRRRRRAADRRDPPGRSGRLVRGGPPHPGRSPRSRASPTSAWWSCRRRSNEHGGPVWGWD